MGNKLSRKNSRSFQISIGEEGAVIAFCDGGLVLSKLFVRSTSDQDTLKLKQLLLESPTSPIHIYIDTLDQSYLQKNIPSASALGVLKVAKNRLERDIPKNHLKACIQVGRMTSGRKDFLFTFISAPLEPPLSVWLDYLIPFENVISGIHFLPIEMHEVIKQINTEAVAQATSATDHKNKFSIKKLLANFSSTTANAVKSNWELLITHNKTGGFRQVAYQDGKIVFSRLLNNINHSDPDVLAGNIEQEIANSVEYLTRLSLRSEELIEIYLVLADEILKNIRTDKLKASRVVTYTPFTLGQALSVIDSATDKDKFADPTLLGCLAKSNKRIVTVFTPVIETVFKYTSRVNIIKKILDVLVPITLLGTILIFVGFTGIRDSLISTSSRISSINDEIKTNTAALAAFEQKIGQDIKIDHLLEIYALYKFLTVQKVNAIEEVFLKLGRVEPSFIRTKLVRWNLNDQTLFNNSNFANKSMLIDNLPSNWNYDATINYDFLFLDTGKNIEELQQKYLDLTNVMKTAFIGYKTDMAPLPQGLAFEEIHQKISIGFQAHKESDTAKLQAAVNRFIQPAQVIQSTSGIPVAQPPKMTQSEAVTPSQPSLPFDPAKNGGGKP